MRERLTDSQRLDRWLYLNPDISGRAPASIAPVIDKIARAESARAAVEGWTVVDPAQREQAAKIRESVEQGLSGYARRRAAELELAEYVEGVARRVGDARMLQAAESLQECRRNGTVGIRGDGRHMVAWDEKCRESRLCPDEAREETMRLAERYTPAMIEWQRGQYGRRLQYAVFTQQNVPHGELAAGKRALLARVKEFLNGSVDACPVAYGVNKVEGRRVVLSSRKRKLKRFPSIAGSFVCQEDPLSGSGGGWNVHVNVLLMVEGRLDWAELRQEWGGNVHLQQIDGTVEAVAASIRELVKYSARAVAEKSASKAGQSPAPAMVEWTDAEFSEWYNAQRGFRRTRSYGAAYKIGKPEAEAVEWSDVFWCGSVHWNGSGYSLSLVDLIPADNFSDSAAKAANKSADNGRNEGSGRQRPPDRAGGGRQMEDK